MRVRGETRLCRRTRRPIVSPTCSPRLAAIRCAAARAASRRGSSTMMRLPCARRARRAARAARASSCPRRAARPARRRCARAAPRRARQRVVDRQGLREVSHQSVKGKAWAFPACKLFFIGSRAAGNGRPICWSARAEAVVAVACATALRAGVDRVLAQEKERAARRGCAKGWSCRNSPVQRVRRRRSAWTFAMTCNFRPVPVWLRLGRDCCGRRGNLRRGLRCRTVVSALCAPPAMQIRRTSLYLRQLEPIIALPRLADVLDRLWTHVHDGS